MKKIHILIHILLLIVLSSFVCAMIVVEQPTETEQQAVYQNTTMIAQNLKLDNGTLKNLIIAVWEYPGSAGTDKNINTSLYNSTPPPSGLAGQPHPYCINGSTPTTNVSRWMNVTMPTQCELAPGLNVSILIRNDLGNITNYTFFKRAAGTTPYPPGNMYYPDVDTAVDFDLTFYLFSRTDLELKGKPLVVLTYPTNNSANNTLYQNFTYNVSYEYNLSNCTYWNNATGTFEINATNTSAIVNNSNNTFYNIQTDEGLLLWNIQCCDNNTNCSYADNNFTYRIDSTDPIILPDYNFENNRTVVVNGTLSGNINFTDESEIYSINVTFSNGTVIFNITNYGDTIFALNISHGVGSTITDSLNARVCDAHTNETIKDLEYKEKDGGIKYVMRKWLWFFDKEWIHIYPKQYSDYDTPTTIKEKDRYSFTFNKKAAANIYETFVVESSNYIDITKKQMYGGHLIVREIGDNGYWIDLKNKDATGYEITRISNTKIEVKVYGLKGTGFNFNSLGELSCVNQTFFFNNLNPTLDYERYVLVGNTTTSYLSVTEDANIVNTINATLFYNNTPYYDTSSNFSISITAPELNTGNSTNVSLIWSLNVNSVDYNLTILYQNVSDFIIDDCTTLSTLALNFTPYDEDDLTWLNATISGSFNYSVNGIDKEYDVSVTSKNNTQICMFPSYATIDTDYYLYYEATGYPQRRYYSYDDEMNNVTQEIGLYLLADPDGIYARFQVVDTYNNPIPEVEGTMQREIGGVLITVEQESTDGSGLATFWVNPDQDYVFTFRKTGYTTETFTLRPTTSEIYTVTLGSTVAGQVLPYSTGIDYKFSPTGDLDNATDYTFNFFMNSTHWDITACTFYLKNGSTTINSSTTSYSTSICDISMNLDTNDYDIIVAQAIYELNSSDPITVSTTYNIWHRYEGQFSLKNFLDDLKALGVAGFNDFTRMVLAFIVILSILGFVSYKSQLRDPEALIIFTLVLVWLFSYIGWLTLNYDMLPTIVGFSLQKYIIAIILSLGGVAYILERHL